VARPLSKATWKREFKLPWRQAGPPNHLDDKVDSDQEVVNKELSLWQDLDGDVHVAAHALHLAVRGTADTLAQSLVAPRLDRLRALPDLDIECRDPQAAVTQPLTSPLPSGEGST